MGRCQEIEWRRVAEPQVDQYDTRVTLHFAHRHGQEPFDKSGLPTCCDGAIALRHDGEFLHGSVPAPLDHPNINIAFELIRRWPEVFIQCQSLLDYIAPFVNPLVPGDNVVGSTCGPARNGFGSIAATVNNHVGFAEAIVHEMGHHKLRALGIGVESAERLITNPPEKVYRSPIRYDCERPMSAVVQAQYSYTHIVALDLVIMDAALNQERDRRLAEGSLAIILPKLKFGREVIETQVEVDNDGAAFFDGFFSWIGRVVDRGDAVLDDLGIEPAAFAHPLDAGNPSKAMAVSRRQAAATPSIPENPVNACFEQIWSGLTEVPCHDPLIEEHAIRDEMVLYCPSREAAYALNSSSRSIWELCDGVRSAGDISKALLAPLNCENAELLQKLTAELNSTLREFHANRLIEFAELRPPER